MNKSDIIQNQIQKTRRYYDLIAYIFKNCLNIDGILQQATKQQDMTQSFDISIGNHRISIRVRSAKYIYRDLTIRSTEYEKLRNKPTKYYFYAWLDDNEDINQFIIIDIESLQDSNLLYKLRYNIKNNDGTSFYAISLQELQPFIVCKELKKSENQDKEHKQK